jgi:hypothetical protein
VLATLVRDGQTFGLNTAITAGLAEWTSDLGSETFQLIGLMQRVLLWGLSSDETNPTQPEASTSSLRSSSGTISATDNMDLQPASTAAASSKSHESVVQLISSIHTLSKGNIYTESRN